MEKVTKTVKCENRGHRKLHKELTELFSFMTVANTFVEKEQEYIWRNLGQMSHFQPQLLMNRLQAQILTPTTLFEIFTSLLTFQLNRHFELAIRE